ncbi:MAG: septum formation initiator family protein [Lachnospiraceae bacterium]|nr:septum formation initiator family protein [Lachnospiraceae bacterium]
MVKRKIVIKKKKQNRLSMLMVSIAVVMVLIVVAIRSVDLQAKQASYDARIAQLNEQIALEQQRTEELNEYEKYTKTKKFVEEVAKDKLGLVYEGEIIFMPEK